MTREFVIRFCKGALMTLLPVYAGCQDRPAASESQNNEKKQVMEYNKLSPQEEHVLINKGTDPAFSPEYYINHGAGIYICRRCNAPLYRSDDKFDAHCGWPSFDDEIKGSVKRVADADGSRTEIICNNCGGHLGHVFTGEGFTGKNTRHCVNNSSIRFISIDSIDRAPHVIRMPDAR